MNFKEEDMAKLISEVETEFKEHLAKAEQISVEEETSEEVSAENASEEVSLAKSEEVETVEYSYDDEDIAEMNEMYASMSKSEVEAHYNSIKSTLFGESEEETPSESLKKSEEETVVVEETEAVEDEEKTLLKSEVEEVKANLAKSEEEKEELKKSIETLTEVVTKIAKRAPARKAVTKIGNVQVLKKSEDATEKEENSVDYSKLSKKEINNILTQNLRSGKIAKSEDRQKVNQYCFNQIEFDAIKHLL